MFATQSAGVRAAVGPLAQADAVNIGLFRWSEISATAMDMKLLAS